MKVEGVRQPTVLVAVTSDVTASTFLPSLLRALVASGYSPVVVAASGGSGLDALVSITDVRVFGMPWDRNPSPRRDIAAALTLGRLIRAERPAAVLAATPKASLISVLVARCLHVPVVINLAWGLRSETLPGIKGRVIASLEALSMRLAHWVLPNSRSLADVIVRRGMAPRARVHVLGSGSSHGVDLERFVPGERRGDRPVVVGFVGRIRRDKGFVELSRAHAALRAKGHDVELLVVGDLEDPTLAPALNLAGVRRESFSNNIQTKYWDMDILALPSWREGFPNVCLEAAASGLPVVVSDATGCRDAVRHGFTGTVVPVRDTVALTTALEQLVTDRALRKEYGQAGRRWVAASFRSGEVCALYADFVDAKVRGSRQAHA